MEIDIRKNEENKICFKLDDKEYEFNYEGLDVFIDKFYSTDDEVKINCDDEFNEYRNLLQKILVECRKDDYVKAVNNAIESQKEIDELDNENVEDSANEDNEESEDEYNEIENDDDLPF